jgi:hypothetical protein
MAIIDILRLLSSPEAQREYQRSVPIADIPAELVNMWFDDLYHPDTDQFRATFQPIERKALAEFHDRYRSVVDHLPRSLENLHSSAEWLLVVKAAQQALAVVGRDGAAEATTSAK